MKYVVRLKFCTEFQLSLLTSAKNAETLVTNRRFFSDTLGYVHTKPEKFEKETFFSSG